MSSQTRDPQLAFATEVLLTGTNPADDAAALTPALLTHEVVRMRVDEAPSDFRAYYDSLVEALGTPIEIAEDYATGGAPTGERWAEIRYDADIPDMAAFRHSKNAQPFHTDESYVSSPAGIMLFYCENAAPSGGETNYISGQALVEHLRANRPELLEALLTTNVRFEKAQDYKDRPIIVIDDEGRVDLNYNYYCADLNQGVAALELNQQFLDYLHNELPPESVLSIQLAPGESAAWRDDRVLHGRNAFEAHHTNDRLIWKTGVVLPA